MSSEIKYSCRGPRQLVAEMRADLNGRLATTQALLEDTSEDAKHPLQAKIKELSERVRALADKDDGEDLGRLGCGQDLSAQIEAVPFDGEVYEFKCPKCGNVGTTRRVKAE